MTATTVSAAVPRLWHVVDARNQIVGRLAPQIARLLVGKHKPTYQAHVDNGDWVVVVNARHAVLTGDKMQKKVYQWHTGWMGGLKELSARQMHDRAPERLIEIAVKGMLAPNRLRTARLRRLRIFPEAEHVHVRQVAQSERYAPAHAAAMAPKTFSPPPKAFTGILVRDVFKAKDNASLAAAAKGLVPQSPEAALKALEAELAARGAAKAGGKQLV